ncbi:class I SAM-dependent methyltransferase [Halococcoides cellulosivorans]|uniref:SAM-dependent methyltransferase n=1 Tax=Halococcoides cellulosivorans TaxID=1679096 RepID=A0A2R4WYB4_9EURY|nr:methyltransferase domain-containing protein [Halococcoides cellulosivorans]AWB26523.1 SAM-dependent methyltransferase [Halococcoides cellulosivorans]
MPTGASSVSQSNRWNRMRYRVYAPIYDLAVRPFRAARERAIDGLEFESGDRVLVVGCGPGPDLDHLPAGVGVIAVDLTPAMVRRAATRSSTHDVSAAIADAAALPIADDSVDAVLAHLVLSVVADPTRVVAEIARVCQPDGQISILDKFVAPGTDGSLVRRAIDPVARLAFSTLTLDLDRLIDGSGLRIDHRDRSIAGLYTIARARPESTGG